MKTQLKTLEVELHTTMTEKEARVLHWLGSYVRAKDFEEHYSKAYPKGVTAEDFDGVMAHLHGHMGNVLDAIYSGRETVATKLRAASGG